MNSDRFLPERELYLMRSGLAMKSGESMKDYALRCREHLKSINPLIAKRLGA